MFHQTDFDECAFQTSGCEQKCDNTEGGFTCSCSFGYELKADNITCNQSNFHFII